MNITLTNTPTNNPHNPTTRTRVLCTQPLFFVCARVPPFLLTVCTLVAGPTQERCDDAPPPFRGRAGTVSPHAKTESCVPTPPPSPHLPLPLRTLLGPHPELAQHQSKSSQRSPQELAEETAETTGAQEVVLCPSPGRVAKRPPLSPHPGSPPPCPHPESCIHRARSPPPPPPPPSPSTPRRSPHLGFSLWPGGAGRRAGTPLSQHRVPYSCRPLHSLCPLRLSRHLARVKLNLPAPPCFSTQTSSLPFPAQPRFSHQASHSQVSL